MPIGGYRPGEAVVRKDKAPLLVGLPSRIALFAGLIAAGLLCPSSGRASEPAGAPPPILGGGPDFGPHEIRLLLTGSEIEFSGAMSAGAAGELRRVLDENPGVDVIHLNSPGGLVTEGRQMLALIRERQLITTTDRYCTSACVLAFLGGRERYLAPGAHLGLHGESSSVVDADHVAAFAQVDKQTMLAMGIPAEFVDRAFSTPSDQLWVPSVGELQSANVITGVSSDYVVAIKAGGPPVEAKGKSPRLGTDSGAYKPPSVEVTPGGITIYRGSGAP